MIPSNSSHFSLDPSFNAHIHHNPPRFQILNYTCCSRYCSHCQYYSSSLTVTIVNALHAFSPFFTRFPLFWRLLWNTPKGGSEGPDSRKMAPRYSTMMMGPRSSSVEESFGKRRQCLVLFIVPPTPTTSQIQKHGVDSKKSQSNNNSVSTYSRHTPKKAISRVSVIVVPLPCCG